jgi:acetyl esterase/lipase
MKKLFIGKSPNAVRSLFSFAAVLWLTGCSTVERAGLGLLYRKASLPEAQVVRDVSYVEGGEPGPKHCLDLFLPKGTKWPVLIFVPGGGWTTGDKGLRVGGADVYGNIGRFFAKQGIGVAVVNYRLQPTTDWRGQVEDVARATSWVGAHISEYGGDSGRIFLSGHSAGAQLICHVALAPRNLSQPRMPLNAIGGVIAVSGAGLDMADQKTYSLGASLAYYEQRFNRAGTNRNWQKEASPLNFAHADAPPFLILYGGWEKAALKRQSHLLHDALRDVGVPSRIITVPRQTHEMMVLTLSRGGKQSGPAMVEFIKSQQRR